jgi:hypothetical protein
MTIDCHVHPAAAGLDAPADLDPRILEDAERLGIDKLIVSSIGSWNYEPPHGECVKANRDTAAIMKRCGERIVGFCYVNPTFPEAVEELERCVGDFGMRGLKLWVSNVATDPRVFPVVEKASQLCIPVLMHAWHKTTGNLPNESRPAQVAELAQRFPSVVFIMAHMGGQWQRGIKAARRVPNLWVDTSGSIVELGMIEEAVEKLGPERVAFGSDASGVDLPVAFWKVAGADVSPEVKRLILGENMRRLLGL